MREPMYPAEVVSISHVVIRTDAVAVVRITTQEMTILVKIDVDGNVTWPAGVNVYDFTTRSRIEWDVLVAVFKGLLKKVSSVVLTDD